ncbi:MAG: DMT family transporter [Anaerolineales bacterium]
MVKSTVLIGTFFALATGLAIGLQATLSSRTGGLIGHVRTGVLTNVVGGALAMIIAAVWMARGGLDWRQVPVPAGLMLATSGALGILIVTGSAFALQRIGVAAGVATLILGQLLVSVIADTSGIGNVEPIPLTVQRVAGLLVMAVAVYLLLPRS